MLGICFLVLKFTLHGWWYIGSATGKSWTCRSLALTTSAQESPLSSQTFRTESLVSRVVTLKASWLFFFLYSKFTSVPQKKQFRSNLKVLTTARTNGLGIYGRSTQTLSFCAVNILLQAVVPTALLVYIVPFFCINALPSFLACFSYSSTSLISQLN